MKLKKQTPRKTSKFIAAFLLLILIVGGGIFAYFQLNKPEDKTVQHTTNSTSEEPSVKQNSDDSTNKSPSSKDQSADDKTKEPLQYSNQANNSGSSSNSDKVSLSAFQNGSTVRVSVTIHQLWNTGNCTLSITNGSASINKTAPVQAMPSYATCQGFSVPVSDLGVGTWQLSLKVTNGSEIATSNQELSVK